MIEYHYETNFSLEDQSSYTDWIQRIILSEGGILGPISYVFCTDDYLLKINQKYLAHDTLTDIVTFNYCYGTNISGDIFISIERVKENAIEYGVSLENELRRVMAHGILHLLKYNDKVKEDQEIMRLKENEKMLLFHVEQ